MKIQLTKNNGNALFLILIAVALFAALSYAVTQSGRGAGDISREKLMLEAAAIEGHAFQIQQALQRMKLISGIEAWEVDYSDGNQGDSGATGNGSCLNNSCELFHSKGGGVAPFRLSDIAKLPEDQFHTVTAYNMQGYSFKNLTVAGIGSNKKDLMFSYMGVNRAFCRAFNQHVGFPNGPGGEPLDDKDDDFIVYKGTKTEEVDISFSAVGLGDEAPEIDGSTAFCVRSWRSQYYYIWLLLIAR